MVNTMNTLIILTRKERLKRVMMAQEKGATGRGPWGGGGPASGTDPGKKKGGKKRDAGALGDEDDGKKRIKTEDATENGGEDGGEAVSTPAEDEA